MTPEIMIRQATASDCQEIAHLLEDPILRQRANLLMSPTPIAVRLLMKSVTLLVILREGELVGIITLERLAAGPWELGYLLRRTDWGQKIMTQALGQLLDRLAPGTRLRATVDEANIASQHVLASNGFVRRQNTWTYQKDLR